MAETGVVCGRFQMFHLKHLEYILAAKMRCKKLFIGIEEFDGSKKDVQNPFTYYERFTMIQDALLDFGVKREEFEIVPFPLNYPDRIFNYVPTDAVFYLNICDVDGQRTKEILETYDVTPEVLMKKDVTEKGITGTDIRNFIISGEEWKDFVPKTVFEYVRSNHLDDRILEYAGVDKRSFVMEPDMEETEEELGIVTEQPEFLDGDEDIQIIMTDNE